MLRHLTELLLGRRNAAGHWEGHLSSSALSTATAVIALHLGGSHQAVVDAGRGWLTANQNSDGGWGDTTLSFSNISTTALCWAALSIAGKTDDRSERWIAAAAGGLEPERLAAAILRRYGKDKTFSIPILTVLALAGKLGPDGWRRVPQLPFELAAFPHRFYRLLRLPVVSYALPALIALGQARHHHVPTPILGLVRNAVRERTLAKLLAIQPSSGGYLEATPLTSFVTMSLIDAGLGGHPVVANGLRFLAASARPDGSWPIDSNLTTWVTTLAVNALGPDDIEEAGRRAILDWLLGQQYRETHPFTHAAPGAWAWTDLPGGVPDADDTAGALLALHNLGIDEPRVREAAARGARWLMDVQNSDGGIPTFCRGWGKLPFDRSSADITAHAIQAWTVWSGGKLPAGLQEEMRVRTARALRFLARIQRRDGAWAPLWFGNQHVDGEENLTYGSARVLSALALVEGQETVKARAIAWLLDAQDPDGGWGGATKTPPSLEETGLAVQALAANHAGATAIERGLDWISRHTNEGRQAPPSPIGFYFAKLWYYEELYPLIYSTGAVRSSASLDAAR